MTGEIILGRGEFDVSIVTGKPPRRVTVLAEGPEDVPARSGASVASSVTLETPRILHDGFAFRARVTAACCRISYQFAG